MARSNQKLSPKQQQQLNAGMATATPISTATPTATKAVRKQNRKPTPRVDRIGRLEDMLATLLAAQSPAPAPAPAIVIPAHIQAMVDKRYITQETALAMASDPAVQQQQQAAGDHIPAPTQVLDTHKHKPAGVVVVGKGKDANECFSFPIATRPATGSDFHDRVTLGYHKVKSFLLCVKAAQAYVDACDLKRS